MNMGKEKFELFGDYILVEAPVVSEKTDSGIIKSEAMIQKEEQEKDQYLKVGYIGDGTEIKEKGIKIGDRVYIANGRYQSIVINKKTYWLVHKTNLYGRIS